MRVWLFSLLFVFGGPAAADQFDPALAPLFEELRAGTGDTDELTDEIETRWISAPEAGTQVLVGRLIAALEAGEADTAAVLAEHVTGLAPSYAEGWVLRAHVAAMEDDLTNAERYYGKAVVLEPRHYNALSALGDLAHTAGRKDEAFRRYREALDINPNMPDTREKADQLRFELNGREI